MKKKSCRLEANKLGREGGGGSTCMNFRQRIFQRRNEKLDRDKTNDKQADLIFENPSSSSHFPPTFYPLIIPLKRRIVGRIGKTIGQNIFARSVGGRNWEKGGKEERNNTVCKVIREREGGKRERRKKIGGEGEIVDFERLNEKVERCRTRGGEGGEGGRSGIAAHRHVSE